MLGKKGFSIGDIAGIGLLLCVGIVVATIVLEVLAGVKSTECSLAGYTWGNFNNVVEQCCVSVNASNSSDCDTVWGGGYAFNATAKGQEGVKKFSDWYPTIGLVVAAAIVIGIIVSYMAKRR